MTGQEKFFKWQLLWTRNTPQALPYGREKKGLTNVNLRKWRQRPPKLTSGWTKPAPENNSSSEGSSLYLLLSLFKNRLTNWAHGHWHGALIIPTTNSLGRAVRVIKLDSFSLISYQPVSGAWTTTAVLNDFASGKGSFQLCLGKLPESDSWWQACFLSGCYCKRCLMAWSRTNPFWT